MRHIIKEVEDKIKAFEALRLVAYKDSVGKWTIGWGHVETAKPGMKITVEQAQALFDKEIAVYEQAVEKAVKVPLTDWQFGALVSFTYNVGVAGFQGSTLIKKLNKGDYDAVPGELMKWNKGTVNGKKVVIKGLTNRRAAEAGMWAKGEHVSSQYVEVNKPKAKVPALQTVGNAVAGLSATSTAVVDQLNPYASYSETIKTILIVAVVAGVALSVVGAVIKARKEA